MFQAEKIFDQMSGHTAFTVTDEHLALLRRAYVVWEPIEFGAPAIDGKRPYGNSDVHADIAEILGVPYNQEADEQPEGVIDRFEILHAGTGVALQIALATGEFRTGRYERDKYRINWRRTGD